MSFMLRAVSAGCLLSGAVFGLFAISWGGMVALTLWPSSTLAWQLNMDLLGVFRESLYVFGDFLSAPAACAVFAAVAAACFVLSRRGPHAGRFLAAHSAFALLAWPAVHQASAGAVGADWAASAPSILDFSAWQFGEIGWVRMALLAACLLSCLAVHAESVRRVLKGTETAG